MTIFGMPKPKGLTGTNKTSVTGMEGQKSQKLRTRGQGQVGGNECLRFMWVGGGENGLKSDGCRDERSG